MYVPGPANLQIPPDFVGNHKAVESWLADNETTFAELSTSRLLAGIAHRDRLIRRNTTELVDLLVSNPELLPVQAAERISLKRLAAKEEDVSAIVIGSHGRNNLEEIFLGSVSEKIIRKSKQVVTCP